MLHPAAVADDEPAPAPAPVLDRAALDRRGIQRKLIRNRKTVYHLLVNRSGRPTGCEHLNPIYARTRTGSSGMASQNWSSSLVQIPEMRRLAHGSIAVATVRGAAICSIW
jgi:hypothetical protein